MSLPPPPGATTNYYPGAELQYTPETLPDPPTVGQEYVPPADTKPQMVSSMEAALAKKFYEKLAKSYSGDTNANGLRDGNGLIEYHDGATYDGEWSNGQMHGYGE